MPKNPFIYHRPNPEQIGRINNVRNGCLIMQELIKDNCPDSAERAEALTNLRQSNMWSNASIVMEEGTEANG